MSTLKKKKTAQNQTPAPLSSRFTSYVLPPDFPVMLYPSWAPPDDPVRLLHYHDCLEIGLCRSGKGILMVSDDVLPYRDGDICVIRPRELHFLRSDPQWPAQWSFIFLDPQRLLSRFVEDFGILNATLLGRPNLAPLITGPAHPQIKGALEELITELQKLRPHTQTNGDRKDAVRALAALLMLRLHRLRVSSVARQDATVSLFNRLVPALQQVTLHWANELHVPGLAASCGMGSRHFTRCFKLVTGKSPLDYITQLRIAMACAGLASGTTSVINVALDNGFASISNFNRSFKRIMGMSPARWRASQGK